METLSIGFVIPNLEDEFTGFAVEGIAAAVFVGMLCGGLVSGFLATKFGKKRTLVAALRFETFALELALRNFRLETLPWQLSFWGTLAWELGLRTWLGP